jgi:hypothetical protein
MPPMRADPACHMVIPTSARPTASIDSQTSAVTTRRQFLVTQQLRRFHMAHVEERHEGEEHRDEQPGRGALRHGGRGESVAHSDPCGQRRTEERGDPRHHRHRDEHAGHAAEHAESQHLRHVDRQDLTTSGAQALEDGDAADLLLHEDSGDARDADAAQDDHDQADETQVVLGAGEVLAEVALGRLVRAHAHERVLQVFAQSGEQSAKPCIGDPHELLVGDAAAEGEERCFLEVGQVDDDARAETESAESTAGLGHDHTAHDEVLPAERQCLPHRDAELGQHLGTHERAAARDKGVCVTLTALEIERAVVRESRTHGFQLNHARRAIDAPPRRGPSSPSRQCALTCSSRRTLSRASTFCATSPSIGA